MRLGCSIVHRDGTFLTVKHESNADGRIARAHTIIGWKDVGCHGGLPSSGICFPKALLDGSVSRFRRVTICHPHAAIADPTGGSSFHLSSRK